MSKYIYVLVDTKINCIQTRAPQLSNWYDGNNNINNNNFYVYYIPACVKAAMGSMTSEVRVQEFDLVIYT